MIVLLESVHHDAAAILADADEIVAASDPTVLDASLPLDQVRALVTRGVGRVTAQTMAKLPNLEVVARCGAGLDNIDTAAASEVGVAVVHTPGSTTYAVAEHALLLMLSVARRVSTLGESVKAGNWAVRNGYEGVELRGKRLGVVGLGAIGTRVAELGNAFDMDVVCWTRRQRELPFPRVELDELVRTSDMIQVCVAAAPETVGLIGATELGTVKPGAIIVNTARGQIVDHDALGDVLRSGRLGGYGADVWSSEPPDAGDTLLGHPGVLVTPHVAAFTDVTYRGICVRAAAAVVAVLEGRDPEPACLFGGP